MNANVRKTIILVLMIGVFFGTVIAAKYFHVSKENCYTFTLVIVTLLLLVQTFFNDKTESYNINDEKRKVYNYSSLSKYNS